MNERSCPLRIKKTAKEYRATSLAREMRAASEFATCARECISPSRSMSVCADINAA